MSDRLVVKRIDTDDVLRQLCIDSHDTVFPISVMNAKEPEYNRLPCAPGVTGIVSQQRLSCYAVKGCQHWFGHSHLCSTTCHYLHQSLRVSLKLTVFYTAIGLLLSVVLMPTASLAQRAVPLIVISGADAELEQNIRAHLGVPAERCNSNQNRLNRLLPGIRRDIERAAQALGYYQLNQQVAIVAAEPAADDSASASACWQLNVNLITNDTVRFGEINVRISDSNKIDLFAPGFGSVARAARTDTESCSV